MARVAREMGVRIDTGAPVERIVFEGRRAAGVRVAGERIDGDAVVVNADFARAMTTLVPEALRPRWTDAKIARKQFSCSTFMLYLGIEGRYEHLRHHNIFLANDYRKNLAEIDTLYRLPENPSLYVQNAGLTDETLAPPGCSTLYVLVPVPHQHVNVDWSQERGRYRALVMKQLEKLGLEGLEQRIRVERVVAPADWDAQGHIHLGATFNLKHTYRQMLHLRPHNRFEDVERMYLVGGGTHPGSGLPVIFESARITARLMEEDMGLGKLSH